MTRVFVAGSRAISKLNDQIRERLDNIMGQQLGVLVGDAHGADKAVQAYLAKCNYSNVIVYSMQVCRNNVGDWPVRRHFGSSKDKYRRHYYGIKDLAMAKDADYGFMLWDGESKGTLTNVVNLLNADKKAVLYLGPQKSFFTLRSFGDLHQLLQACGIENASLFLGTLGLSEGRAKPLASLG